MQVKCTISQLEITPEGVIQCRMFKVIDDGVGNEHRIGGPNHYHRFAIEPGANPAKIIDVVNEHLAKLDPPITNGICKDAAKEIKKLAKVWHTRDRVKTYQEKVKRANERVNPAV